MAPPSKYTHVPQLPSLPHPVTTLMGPECLLLTALIVRSQHAGQPNYMGSHFTQYLSLWRLPSASQSRPVPSVLSSLHSLCSSHTGLLIVLQTH